MPFDSLAGLATWINAHALWPNLPVWAYVAITLVDTHITTTCVTLYLHRCQTHGAIAFAAPVAHLMRLWLWVRTAMPTREWRKKAHIAAQSTASTTIEKIWPG